METIILKPLYHRGQESIGLYYDNYTSLNRIVKKLPGIRWSETNRCWYMPLDKSSYRQIHEALQNEATIDSTELKGYLEKRKE